MGFPEEFRSQADLERRIAAARDALAHAPRRGPRRVEALMGLAGALGMHYQFAPRRLDLDEAIDLLWEAKRLAPRLSKDHARVRQVLVSILCMRRSGDDVSNALDLAESAHLERAGNRSTDGLSMCGLAMALLMEAQATNSSQLVERAIAMLEDALGTVTRIGPISRHVNESMVKLALAMALTARYSLHGAKDPVDHDRVLALLEEIDHDALAELAPGFDAMRNAVTHGLSHVSAVHIDGAQTARFEQLSAQADRAPAMWRDKWQLMNNTAAFLDAERDYSTSGDLLSLSGQLDRLYRELDQFDEGEDLQAVTMIMIAEIHHLRYRTSAMAGAPLHGELERAIELAQGVLAQPDNGLMAAAMGIIGLCQLARHVEGIAGEADLDEGISLVRKAVAALPEDSTHNIALSGQLAEALMARGDPDDVNAAEEMLTAMQARLPARSPFRAIVAVRLAVLLQFRSMMSGLTEDVLRAGDASRRSAAAVAEFSLIWAYDAYAMWSMWAWEHAPVGERAEAHQKAVEFLHRLATAQLGASHSELALKRLSGHLLGRAIHALASDGRLVDAVVTAETGRGVLLSAALGLRSADLDATVPDDLRVRFAESTARVRQAEAALTSAVSGGTGRPNEVDPWWK